jgi:hypothetical protein
MNPFEIEIDVPEDEDMAGKVRLTFKVPYMWFAFYQPLNVLGYTRIQDDDEWLRCQKNRIAEEFGRMVTDEILRCWPKEEIK